MTAAIAASFVERLVDDVQHGGPATHPATSASVSGFSSLAYSDRAARSTCDMPTGSLLVGGEEGRVERDVPNAAAGHAQLRQPLDVEPVGRRGRSETPAARSAARWAASGNGNSTTKRIRRRNAVSSALFRFVVRIASPP